MKAVYLLCKHPPHPYTATHLKAGEVVAVYATREEPDRIAAEKNARRTAYLWEVHRKSVRAQATPQPTDTEGKT